MTVTTVEIYTREHVITGQLITGRARVSDVFNQAAGSFLTIGEASITHLAGGRGSVAGVDVQVNPGAVVLVVPHDSRARRFVGPDERSQLRILKEAHHIVIEAPPFSVAGQIHLARETRLLDALLSTQLHFIPLTDVSVAATGLLVEPVRAGAAIVNRRFMEVIYPAPAPAIGSHTPRLLLKRL